MGGENIARRGHLPRLVVGQAELLHDHPGPLRSQKRRVPFVHVADGRPDAERLQRPHAADAQYDLLLDPQFAVASVERSRHTPVVDRVLRDIGIEQVERHASHLGFPDPAPTVAVPESRSAP